MINTTTREEKSKNQALASDLWTVFLVEDDLDDQRMAMRVLQESPFIGEIVCISDSARLFDRLEKLRFLKEGTPNVLIMLDIHMPGLDGLKLLEQLRANSYTRDFPVVMITGDRQPEKIYESYLKNASCFISKPMTMNHLNDIHTVLEYGLEWHRRFHTL